MQVSNQETNDLATLAQSKYYGYLKELKFTEQKKQNNKLAMILINITNNICRISKRF